MKIDARLEDISDGRLYDINDMVKADTRGCDGCSECCHGVGPYIILNPFDLYQLTSFLTKSFDDLIEGSIELSVEDKVTLPNLMMVASTEACVFLGADERCQVHSARPSICRLFPLGRYYEDKDFKYIFKAGECPKPNLSKVKVKKWIDIENYAENKEFILAWHGFLKALKWRLKFVRDEHELKEMNQYLLDTFYRTSYDNGDFYQLFFERLAVAKDHLGVL